MCEFLNKVYLGLWSSKCNFLRISTNTNCIQLF